MKKNETNPNEKTIEAIKTSKMMKKIFKVMAKEVRWENIVNIAQILTKKSYTTPIKKKHIGRIEIEYVDENHFFINIKSSEGWIKISKIPNSCLKIDTNEPQRKKRIQQAINKREEK